MLSPFLEGNSLQIIFMAICVGLVLLLLKEKLPLLHTLVEQLNTAVQFMMETVSRYIPVFTFISLFTLILSDSLSGLGGVVKAILLAMAACIIWPLLYALVAALRLKVSYPLLLRKLLPTYLIALSTASSSAALSTNLDTCEKELGISERISRFAVPLGQVIFKTGGGVGFFVLAMGLAEYYDVAMPLSWVDYRGVDVWAASHCGAADPRRQPDLLYGTAGPVGDPRTGGRPGDCRKCDLGFFYDVLRDILPAIRAVAGRKPAGAFEIRAD